MGIESLVEPFTAQSEQRNGIAQVALRGELDLATVPILKEQISLVEQDGLSGVIYDLRRLTFIDSSGLVALFRASTLAAQNGRRFAIVGVDERLKRVFQIIGMEGLLDGPEGPQLAEEFSQGGGEPGSPAYGAYRG
jgi:anti-sigma B factor antagonist